MSNATQVNLLALFTAHSFGRLSHQSRFQMMHTHTD